MKLKCNFETIEMGDEYVSVPVGEKTGSFHGVFKLNKEGKEIFDLLIKDTSEESIVDTLSSEYENDRATIAKYVHQTLETLRSNDVIVD